MARSKAPRFKATVQPVRSHVFNVYGWAMKDRRQNPNQHLLYHGHKNTTFTALMAFQACKANRKKAIPTDLELGSQTDFASRTGDHLTYLVVGYTTKRMIEDGSRLGKQKKAPRTDKNIGITNPPHEVIVESNTGVGDPDDTILHVVIGVKPVSRTYFVLMEPSQGLCRPYVVDAKAVFFFWQFRVRNVSDISPRARCWRDTVKMVIKDNTDEESVQDSEFIEIEELDGVETTRNDAELDEIDDIDDINDDDYVEEDEDNEDEEDVVDEDEYNEENEAIQEDHASPVVRTLGDEFDWDTNTNPDWAGQTRDTSLF